MSPRFPSGVFLATVKLRLLFTAYGLPRTAYLPASTIKHNLPRLPAMQSVESAPLEPITPIAGMRTSGRWNRLPTACA